MAERREGWPVVVDRLVQYPNRVTIDDNEDGTSDLRPAPGNVADEGTPIVASLFEQIGDYVDEGDEAASAAAATEAVGKAREMDGALREQLAEYAYQKASEARETAIMHADQEDSILSRDIEEGDAALQRQIDAISELGAVPMSQYTPQYIADGIPIEEIEDNGFMGKLAASALWEAIEAKIEEARKTVLLAAHPVGSYYWSSDPTDPSELFGGEWEAVKDRFVWAKGDSDAVGATGGSKTVELTVAQMPAHAHTVNSHTHTTPNHTHTWANEGNNVWSGNQTLTSSRVLFAGVKKSGEQGLTGASSGSFSGWTKTTAWMASSGGGTSGAAAPATNSVGSGSAHENMPPYVAAHCWRRVA